MKCPIKYYENNLIFHSDGSCWAAFRIIGYDYDFLDDESKIALLYRSARFLSGFISRAQILIIPMEQNNKEHFKMLKGRIRKTDALYDAACNHAQDTEKYLDNTLTSSGEVNDYQFYLIAKLSEDNPDFMDTLRDTYQYMIKDPINAVNVALNLDTRDILRSRIKKSIATANKFYSAQSKKMNLEAITATELQTLFRRMAYRGLNQPLPLFYADGNFNEWKPGVKEINLGKTDSIVRPYGHDIVNLFSGTIQSRNRMITIHHNRKVSYQTFLVITHVPEPLEFPGCEWLYMLQKYNTQAEVCITLKSNAYRDSLHKIDLKKRELSSQIGNVAEANTRIPEDLLEGQDSADTLENEIRTYREPVLSTSIIICLSADSPELLEEKVILIKEAYEDMQFAVERPLADQLKLYMNFIPSNCKPISDYVLQLTPLCLASGIIGAVHELGDKSGPYIGTTGAERKPVFLDLGLACLRNKSASATFFGNLGVGKSFNANLLLVLTVLYGGYGLIFDPKGERTHWITDFHIFDGMINLVSLSADATFKGTLDPYNIYKEDIDMANELALNVISELFRIIPTSPEYTALLTAAKQLKEDYKAGTHAPSMLYLASVLERFDPSDELCKTASALARRLRLQEVAGMSTLLFGDGSEEAINLDNRLNILQIQNLKLPSPETPKTDYTTEEMLSTVIMMVLSHFAKKFALIKRPVFKCILFDESWALGKTAEGVKLYDFLSRMGRSLFTGIIFNGHSVLDIPTEGIKNTISYKFCFQTTNDSEAVRMCDYLGMEPTEDNKDLIKNLGNGQCLFQDLDGHIGILDFDAVFQDFIDVFSTTPTTDEPAPAKPTQETANSDTSAADIPDMLSGSTTNKNDNMEPNVLSGVALLQRFSQQTASNEPEPDSDNGADETDVMNLEFSVEELLTKV